MNTANIETGIEHFASGIGSFFKAALHVAVGLAPVAAKVASVTGHEDVVGDIEKAGAAAQAASSAMDQIK